MSELHKGHRKRMDMKAEASGLYNLPEHEVLEMILFAIIPRGNTNEIAIKLINEFGSIGNVLNADADEIEKVDGVGAITAKFLTQLYDILGIVERSLKFPKKQIKTREEAIEYVKPFFYGRLTEQFFMVSLNKTGCVLNAAKLSDGVADEVHIYPRNIAIRALKENASKVIIAHNHPGGTLSASFADEQMTNRIRAALDAVGVELFDSIIVSGGEGVSVLRELF